MMLASAYNLSVDVHPVTGSPVQLHMLASEYCYALEWQGTLVGFGGHDK